ncbi:unnamed protein product, partial [Phaeothamnion confervicola]
AAETAELPALDGVWTELSSPTGVRNLAFPILLASEAQEYSATTVEVIAAAAAATGGPLPSSAADALEGREATEWMAAMQEEWHNVPSPAGHGGTGGGHNVIGCRWVFARKRASDETILRYRVRLVAQGFAQRPGVDYGATFARVMHVGGLNAISPCTGGSVQLRGEPDGVVTAYLNAPLEEMLWMRRPPGPLGGFDDCVALQVLKAIDGLKQA